MRLVRLLAASAFVASLVGCSHSIEGSGAPAPQPEAKPEPSPTESEEVVSGGEKQTEPTPIKASDIKGVSVSIDGVKQPISEGVVNISSGAIYLTLRVRGSDGSFNAVTMSIDHVGTGCARSGDNFAQDVIYYPKSGTQENDDPIYASPPSLNCGMNILELDKRRDGRVVGIYDGELKRQWGSASNPGVVKAVIKFNVPMPEQQQPQN